MLTAEVIQSWLRKRRPDGKFYTQADVARMYGVSRQAITDAKRRNPDAFETTPREDYLKHFPWRVPAEMAQQKPYRAMRDHAEFMATGGEEMSEEKLRGLRSFYKKLRTENVVLEFDPAIEPVKRITPRGGFAYRPREERDEDRIIRENEYTTLTEEGRSIWTLPPREP